MGAVAIRLLILVGLLGIAAPAGARAPSTVPLRSTEIVPMGGFAGASPTFGLRALMGYQNLALELAADQVVGRVAVLYPVTVNAVVDLAQTRRAVPFGIIGGGLLMALPSNAVGSNATSTLGLCYGGGLRYYFTPTFGLRLESKLFLTEIEAKTENTDARRRELISFQSITLGVIVGFI